MEGWMGLVQAYALIIVVAMILDIPILIAIAAWTGIVAFYIIGVTEWNI